MTKISFSGRKKARKLTLQALYSWLISKNELRDIELHFLIDNAATRFDIEYFKTLLHDIPLKINEIETHIEPYLDRRLEELDPIELTILRIGVYELLYRLDIPYKVVINESLELAKSFGAVDSFKFVNGILDKVAKQVRA
jgi:N utilization substance protein B